MPIDTKSRMRAPFAHVFDLPPPFRPVALREVGDAFAHAMAIAADEGAGALVHVGRFDLAEFAVVLEPAEPLRTARRSVYVGLSALAYALAAHAPPEKSISFDWPDAIRMDGGLIGGVRLGWPEGAHEDETPAWLVLGGIVRTVAMGATELGLRPLTTALEEEGFEDLDSGRIVESFARHLMAACHSYQEKGFGELAKRYLAHLGLEQDASRSIDENGDFLVWRISVSAAIESIEAISTTSVPGEASPTGADRDRK